MAFFGLTALGPQNEFKAGSKFRTFIVNFEDKDFETVWKRSCGDNKHTMVSKLQEMIEMLFYGKVPVNDHKVIFEAFDRILNHEEGATMSYYTFVSTLAEVRDACIAADEEQERSIGLKQTVEFNSCVTQHEYMRRNRKFERTLKEKQSNPITAMQEYGWTKPAKLVQPTTGRKQTDITEFQKHLIAAGVAL